ncbi:AraC family transcriptional regulator [Nocardia flavorosea]|uniref:AraC family transcriptional regulator n=1 Tax=Nocardia flavorosea TaxID=53429 RepID=A0A846YEW2_9NOCA|nr:AraC family transcriptional regulator [Nocardia flavorosea]NKY57417.1 AraC family transcriptional regulator [Nocardia flavorosea]
MDPLSKLLGGIRAEGAVLTHAVLEAPWTIRFADRAPLTMMTVLRGGGTLLLPDGTERRIAAGDTAVVRGCEPFLLADRADSVALPHAEYEIACFVEEPKCEASLGEGRWGNDSAGETALIVGAYRASGRRHERLLRALPPVLVVTDDAETCAWMASIAADASARPAGAQAMMDRLLDWALVCTLRDWFDGQDADAPGWYRGPADPVVGPALEAMHSQPAAGWTVATLASKAGVSRALFAKRFTDVMGQSPLAYLTECRMDEAEELLADRDLTVAQVAKAVGYADAFGFSAAFKRHRGLRPSDFRGKVASF